MSDFNPTPCESCDNLNTGGKGSGFFFQYDCKIDTVRVTYTNRTKVDHIAIVNGDERTVEAGNQETWDFLQAGGRLSFTIQSSEVGTGKVVIPLKDKGVVECESCKATTTTTAPATTTTTTIPVTTSSTTIVVTSSVPVATTGKATSTTAAAVTSPYTTLPSVGSHAGDLALGGIALLAAGALAALVGRSRKDDHRKGATC